MRSIAPLLALVAAATAQSCGQVYMNEQRPAAAMALAANLTAGAGIQTGEALIGGVWADDGAWPWTVAICDEDWFGNCNFKGAGVIISEKYILTSYSWITESATKYYVRAGTTDQKSGGVKIQVSKILGVSGEDSKTKYNDIALVTLAYPLNFNNYVQPICVAKSDTGLSTPGNKAWFTGWGHSSNSVFATIETYLRQAQLNFADDSICYSKYKKYDRNVEYCVGGGATTTCDYDRGGPLMQKKNGRWYLYGISATTDYIASGCASATIFTRVSAFCWFVDDYSNVQCID